MMEGGIKKESLKSMVRSDQIGCVVAAAARIQGGGRIQSHRSFQKWALLTPEMNLTGRRGRATPCIGFRAGHASAERSSTSASFYGHGSGSGSSG